MKITSINDIYVIELTKYADDRGFFMERFHEEKFKSCSLPIEFRQDNHSRSMPGVIRGLHYQYSPHQGKLVNIIRGKIWDVVVDIRSNSPNYCKHYCFELDESHVLWVPPGFAHGFCVLGNEPADVLYKASALYNPKSESGIRYSDPDLNIKWPITNPIVSDRDKNLPLISEYRKNPIY
jgi:dTDP-4-dehydrorhamnose 3,5-epimerase